MPAIELQRLNAEIIQLTNQFDQVDSFYVNLVNLLEKYANWAYRSGQAAYRNVQMPRYHTPALVSQKLIMAIKPKCQANPAKSLELMEFLRNGNFYEQRSLAINILSLQPIEDPQKMMQYVDEWANAEKEISLLDDLFVIGCVSIRNTAPQVWLRQLETWLDSSDSQSKFIGLRGMIASVDDTQFTNLPNLFILATGLYISMSQGLYFPMEELLDAFIRRSPAETCFFLRQILLRKHSPGTARLVRKKLNILPVDYQPVLRSLLFDGSGQGNNQEPSTTEEDLV